MPYMKENHMPGGKALLLLAGLALLAVLVPAGLCAQDTVAYVGELGGTVRVTRANPGEVMDAELGMLLSQGDMIKTEAASYAAVVFQDDGSRVKLGENSQLTLNTQRREQKLTKRLFLNVGKLWAKVTRGRDTDFEVGTPTSVASVKGTRFIAEDDGRGQTWYWSLDDAIQVSSDAGSVTIRGGEYARVTSEGIQTGSFDDGDVPLEPGRHKLIIYMNYEDESSSLQKELHIDFEVPSEGVAPSGMTSGMMQPGETASPEGMRPARPAAPDVMRPARPARPAAPEAPEGNL
ncbi:MAG: FecR family protein [Spirochaetota bacterium]